MNYYSYLFYSINLNKDTFILDLWVREVSLEDTEAVKHLYTLIYDTLL